MLRPITKSLIWVPLVLLGACQSVGAGRYVGRGEFDTLTRRVEEVEARVGLPPWGGGLPVLVSTRTGTVIAPEGTAPAGRPPGYSPPPETLLPPAEAPSGLRPPAGHPRAGASAGSSTYQEGQSLLKAGKYDQAARAFSRLLTDNPGGRLAPNARYWLGECHYAQGRYGDAATEFQRCADDYPQTDKAADALLKLSYSYDRLGDGPRAMAALDRLLGHYPGSSAAGLVRSGRGHF